MNNALDNVVCNPLNTMLNIEILRVPLNANNKFYLRFWNKLQ